MFIAKILSTLLTSISRRNEAILNYGKKRYFGHRLGSLSKFRSNSPSGSDMEGDKNLDTGEVDIKEMTFLAGDNEQSKGVEVDENRVHFYTSVNNSSVLELNKILRTLDIEMQCLSIRLKIPPIPIELRIHSEGGDLFAGLAAVDAIRNVKTPIHTYVEGSAASAATLMSICGTKRFMYRHSVMLIHQISSLMVHGTHEQFKDEMSNQALLMSKIENLYLEKTSMPEEEIKEMLKHDLWLDSDTCLKLGLVDEVI